MNANPFEIPLLQEYDAAPLPLKVTLVPAHTVWFAVAVTVGIELTVTLVGEAVVATHPVELFVTTHVKLPPPEVEYELLLIPTGVPLNFH